MPDDGRLMKAFLDGLGEHGYIEGQNIVIERRTAEGRFDKLTTLAEQLVRAKVDVIIAPTTPAARAARGATASIPIVFTIVSDPIGSGLVSSFSHPGGNVTGVTDMDVDLAEKRLDMLKQLIPQLKRVGALGDPSDKVWEPEWRQAQEAAQKLHIEVIPLLVATPEDLETVFVGLNRRVEALLVAPQAFFAVHRRTIIELESLAKLPAMHERRVFPDAGALIS